MKAYKYKLKPSAKIIAIFEAWLAICCELYNATLQERRDAYRMAGKSVGFAEQCAELPAMKVERPDAARVHSQVLQASLKFWLFRSGNGFTVSHDFVPFAVADKPHGFGKCLRVAELHV